MLHADPQVVAAAIPTNWDVPGPVRLAGLPAGATADVWTALDAHGGRHVAKLVYDSQPAVEQGLAVAEEVQARTGLVTGAPLRTRADTLTVMTPSVRGLAHPLALLTFVDGPPIWPGDGLRPEAAADLLARFHAVAPHLHSRVDPFERRLAYIEDDEPIAYAARIRPALRDAVHRVRRLLEARTLTAGVCYGDGPEARVLADGEVALVDWGGVTGGPLLWDVATWAHGFCAAERAQFLDHYATTGPLPPVELAHLEAFERLRDAWLLRFRAYRVARADHYDETAEDDARKVVDYAAALGVDLRPGVPPSEGRRCAR